SERVDTTASQQMVQGEEGSRGVSGHDVSRQRVSREPGSAAPRRYGILGFPFSRLPPRDGSYPSLDAVTWSTVRALSRRGAQVIVGAWEVHEADIGGIEVVPVDGRPDWVVRAAVRASTRRRGLPRGTSPPHPPFYLLSGAHPPPPPPAHRIPPPPHFPNPPPSPP